MKPREVCPVVSFSGYGTDNDVAVNHGVMAVDAPHIAPRAPGRKGGALLTFWTDAGRYVVTLDADQLKWLRLELAKHAPRVAPVETV